MVVLDWTKERIALFLVGSHTNYPTFFMLGSGSGTVTNVDTVLEHAVDRQAITSVNGSTAQKVKWTGDWNSFEISGTKLREFGMCMNGAGITGSMWSKIGLPMIEFDGTNELRIEENWEVY